MTEHAIILRIPLTVDPVGTETEQNVLAHLVDGLSGAISKAGFGEYDGFEFTEKTCVIYMYAADGDRLHDIIKPILSVTSFPTGAEMTKRYGRAGDPSVKMDVTSLASL